MNPGIRAINRQWIVSSADAELVAVAHPDARAGAEEAPDAARDEKVVLQKAVAAFAFSVARPADAAAISAPIQAAVEAVVADAVAKADDVTAKRAEADDVAKAVDDAAKAAVLAEAAAAAVGVPDDHPEKVAAQAVAETAAAVYIDVFTDATTKIDAHNEAVAAAEAAASAAEEAQRIGLAETTRLQAKAAEAEALAIHEAGHDAVRAMGEVEHVEQLASTTSEPSRRARLKELTGKEEGLLIEILAKTPIEHYRDEYTAARPMFKDPQAEADWITELIQIGSAMGGNVEARNAYDLDAMRVDRDAAVQAEVDRLTGAGFVVSVIAAEDVDVSPTDELVFLRSEVARLSTITASLQTLVGGKAVGG